MIAMPSVPPADPNRHAVPAADEPRYHARAAAPTSMQRNARRAGVATLAAMLLAVLALVVITLV